MAVLGTPSVSLEKRVVQQWRQQLSRPFCWGAGGGCHLCSLFPKDAHPLPSDGALCSSAHTHHPHRPGAKPGRGEDA